MKRSELGLGKRIGLGVILLGSQAERFIGGGLLLV